MLENTEGVIKKYNPEKLATLCTQDNEKQNNNNPEKLATLCTQDNEKQIKTHCNMC